MSPMNARVLARRPTVETSTRSSPLTCGTTCSQSPRQLPSRYLYDALGSALFDAICQLPWYGLTRAETAPARRSTRPRSLPPSVRSRASSSSARAAAKSWRRCSTAGAPPRPSLDLHLIDVSTLALETASRALSAFDGVPCRHPPGALRGRPRRGGPRSRFGGGRSLRPVPRIEHRQLRSAGSRRDAAPDPRGARAGRRLSHRRRPLKPERDLLLAYDDPLGVTAAFNRNLLVRINRELGADFDLERLRASRGLEPGGLANRDAPGQHAVSARRVPAAQHRVRHERRRDDLDGKLVQVPAEASSWRCSSRNGFGRARQWIEPSGAIRADAGRAPGSRNALALIELARETRGRPRPGSAGDRDRPRGSSPHVPLRHAARRAAPCPSNLRMPQQRTTSGRSAPRRRAGSNGGCRRAR